MQVKKGDNVKVIAGKDKGKDGKILTVSPKTNRIIVEGVNIQKRHTKPRSAQKTGGILDQAGAIDASNVMILCPKCKKATRVGMVFNATGNKYRACKKCGENLDKHQEAVKKDAAKKPVTKKEKKEDKKVEENPAE